MKVAIFRDVLPPHRGTSKSAGFDLFVPRFTPEYIKAFNSFNPDSQTQAFLEPSRKLICIHPNGRVYIPSGIRIEIPEGSALFVKNKGGTSWNARVTKIAELIDEDYQGEIFITLVNYSSFKTTLEENQKLIQLVRAPVFYDDIKIVPVDQLFQNKTERGEGSMGSTGK